LAVVGGPLSVVGRQLAEKRSGSERVGLLGLNTFEHGAPILSRKRKKEGYLRASRQWHEDEKVTGVR
jgi:hypothetical protein